jgi:hypothetical protein
VGETVFCNGCGAPKDPKALEVYPYPEDGLADGPIEPLLEVETDRCRGDRHVTARVCHECFHKLSPDMWIDRRGWDSLRPVVSYDNL